MPLPVGVLGIVVVAATRVFTFPPGPCVSPVVGSVTLTRSDEVMPNRVGL